MEINSKWIVEQDSIVLRKCLFHKDIAENIEDVKGGGWFYYSHDNDAFILYSTSDQFGSPTREQMLDCIAKNNIGRFLNDDRYAKHKIYFSTQYKLEDAMNDFEYLNEVD